MSNTRILLVAATELETRHLRRRMGIGLPASARMEWVQDGKEITLIHAGIGMVNTAYHLGRIFLQQPSDLAIQFGIAGAFSCGPQMLEVVEVGTEIFGELGAGSPDGFLDLEAMGFENFSYSGKSVGNILPNPNSPVPGLRVVRGLTVNKVHGDAGSILETEQIWAPEVESMEGAAFFQCCLKEGIPFHEFRGISNRVEPRNRAGWKIPEAAEAVQDWVLGFLNTL